MNVSVVVSTYEVVAALKIVFVCVRTLNWSAGFCEC